MATLVGISLIPLIAFAVLNYYKGLKFGVYSGMIASVLVGIGMWVFFDYFDYDLLIMVLLLFLLGYFSIRTENELFFKLQPVISSVISVLVLAFYQFFDQPLILKMSGKMQKLLPPEQVSLLQDEQVQQILVRMTGHGMLWILLHAAVLAYAAMKSSTTIWLCIKALFIPYFCLVIFVTEWVIARF